MAHPDEILKYQIALAMLEGIGPVSAKMLVSYCGSVEGIFRKKKGQLEKIPGIGSERAQVIVKQNVFEQAEKEVKFIRKHKIETLFYLDQKYPARLKNCDDSPILLFYKGNADLNARRMAAIVGTRHITSYGKEITDQLVEEFAKLKVTIVSGLAYGIDVHAHRSAVRHGIATIGVTAHGLDRIYPSDHIPTAEKMIRNGGILTEYPSKTNPDRENFPARNRIVAGLCDATIVVESALRGGALITAELANDYNRDVFAIPGKASDNYSQGCNMLIRLNKAMLAESAAQIAEVMQWDTGTNKSKKAIEKQLLLFTELNEEEKILVHCLRLNHQMNIDLLAAEAGMPVSKVSSMLLSLEFTGLIRSLPGKVYELVNGS